jgi:hypothetical protein
VLQQNYDYFKINEYNYSFQKSDANFGFVYLEMISLFPKELIISRSAYTFDDMCGDIGGRISIFFGFTAFFVKKYSELSF